MRIYKSSSENTAKKSDACPKKVDNNNAVENKDNDDNDPSKEAEESAGSEVDEVEKESKGELESV